jgi:DNA N-6-adenine-methyltransferase (Dam)/Protein of unknown function (DUF3102)
MAQKDERRPGGGGAAASSLASDPQHSPALDGLATGSGRFPTLAADLELRRFAFDANDAYQRAQDAASEAVAWALRAGQALIQAKALVEHGSWASWLADNFEGSERSARLYMQLAREVPKLDEKSATAVADLSLREAAKAIASRHTMTVMGSSASPEWFTPAAIVDLATEVLGEIDLDPSWHPDSPVVARTTFTAETDGLAQPWAGRVWLNPPYGREIDDWVARLAEHHAAGAVTEAIALVPARVDTAWFRRLDPFPRCFVWGRLQFVNADTPAPFPSAIVYLGPNVPRFADVFGRIGGIWVQLGREVP